MAATNVTVLQDGGTKKPKQPRLYGSGAPGSSDKIVTNVGLYQKGSTYYDYTNHVQYVREATTGAAADWVNSNGSITVAAAYGATLAITPTRRTTHYNVAQLTGAMTINATVTSLQVNDKVYFTFAADGTNRVVTFGTNMKSSGTMTVTASKFAAALFIFDGTNLLQLSATVEA